MKDQPTDLLRFASDYPVGTLLRDFVDPDSGLRMMVVRGPFSFCAYVGVKADHALAGLEELEFSCHHGVTFQQWGAADSQWPEGWYWWGWDYAHFTDFIDFEGALPADAPPEVREHTAKMQRQLMDGLGHSRPKNWALGEVVEDTLDVMMELKQALTQSAEWASLLR